MNENIDLTKILKDCPKGWKFYSSIYEDLLYSRMYLSSSAPKITFIKPDSISSVNYYQDGKRYLSQGECTLFPSKDQRDWSKFTAPWYKQDKDDERLRKTTIAFLKDFAEQSYENAVECIDWLEKQNEDKKEINNFDVLPGLYKCIHRMFDGTPDGRLLFEIDNVYKCLSKHDRAEFEVSYGHSVYLEDPIVRKYFIPFEGEQIPSPKFKVGDWIITPTNKVLQITSIEGTSYRFNNKSHYWEICYCDEECRLWTIEDAKDGDMLAFSNDTIVIFKDLYNSTSFHSYCHIEDGIFDFNKDELPDWWNSEGFKPATKEQRDLLFQKIQEAGYKWNVETKTLEKLVKPKFKVGDRIRHKESNKDNVYVISKVYDDAYGVVGLPWMIYMKYQDRYELVPNKFDVTTLQPFDKVLVRDSSDRRWRCAIFSHVRKEDENYTFKYVTTACTYEFCIPFNDDTKHLVGTKDEPLEFYRYWES